MLAVEVSEMLRHEDQTMLKHFTVAPREQERKGIISLSQHDPINYHFTILAKCWMLTWGLSSTAKAQGPGALWTFPLDPRGLQSMTAPTSATSAIFVKVNEVNGRRHTTQLMARWAWLDNTQGLPTAARRPRDPQTWLASKRPEACQAVIFCPSLGGGAPSGPILLALSAPGQRRGWWRLEEPKKLQSGQTPASAPVFQNSSRKPPGRHAAEVPV